MSIKRILKNPVIINNPFLSDYYSVKFDEIAVYKTAWHGWLLLQARNSGEVATYSISFQPETYLCECPILCDEYSRIFEESEDICEDKEAAKHMIFDKLARLCGISTSTGTDGEG